MLQDIRFGARKLRKSPGFTIVAVLTLSLGIGANTAIFTLIHAVMLRNLPVASPSELYRLGKGRSCCVVDGFQGNFGIFSYALYKQLRENTPEFSEMAAFSGGLNDVSVRTQVVPHWLNLMSENSSRETISRRSGLAHTQAAFFPSLTTGPTPRPWP